jgi:hypothetical protein
MSLPEVASRKCQAIGENEQALGSGHAAIMMEGGISGDPSVCSSEDQLGW